MFNPLKKFKKKKKEKNSRIEPSNSVKNEVKDRDIESSKKEFSDTRDLDLGNKKIIFKDSYPRATYSQKSEDKKSSFETQSSDFKKTDQLDEPKKEKKGKQKKKKKKGCFCLFLFLIILIILLLILGAGAIYYFYLNSPDIILKKAKQNLIQAKSYEYSGEAIVSSPTSDLSTDLESNKILSINFEGVLDKNDPNNPKEQFNLKYDLANGSRLDLETISVKNQIFLKLNNIPPYLAFNFEDYLNLYKYQNNWIKFNAQELPQQLEEFFKNNPEALTPSSNNTKSQNPNPSNLEEITLKQQFKNTEILINEEKLADEVILGKNCHHLKVEINKEEAQNLIESYLDTNLNSNSTQLNSSLKDLYLEQTKELIDYLNDHEIEVWITKNTYQLYQIKLTPKKSSNSSATSLTLNLFNYNKEEFEINPPQTFIDSQYIFEEIEENKEN
jgi:hypothetical protein